MSKTKTKKKRGLFPALLKHWRGARGMSQLDLALAQLVAVVGRSHGGPGEPEPQQERGEQAGEGKEEGPGGRQHPHPKKVSRNRGFVEPAPGAKKSATACVLSHRPSSPWMNAAMQY